jgi:hypothetical protein
MIDRYAQGRRAQSRAFIDDRRKLAAQNTAVGRDTGLWGGIMYAAVVVQGTGGVLAPGAGRKHARYEHDHHARALEDALHQVPAYH